MSFPRYPSYKDSGVEWFGRGAGALESTASNLLRSIESVAGRGDGICYDDAGRRGNV